MKRENKQLLVAGGLFAFVLFFLRTTTTTKTGLGGITSWTPTTASQATAAELNRRNLATKRAYDLLAVDWDTGDAGLPTRRPSNVEALEIRNIVTLLRKPSPLLSAAQLEYIIEVDIGDIEAKLAQALKLPAYTTARAASSSYSGDIAP